MKKKVYTILTAIILIFFFSACNSKSSEIEIKIGIEKGNKIPDFEISNLFGKKENISDYKGKLIFLNFWATWCPPCRAEMPSMETIYKNKGNKNFEIIAISVDQTSTQKIYDFILKNNYSFPVYHDPTGAISNKFLVQSIPQTFIIDKNGVILEKYTGAFDWTTLDIDKLLQKDD